MTTAKRLLTADDLLVMPDDGKRHELIRGELIEMPLNDLRHGIVAGRILRQLGNFVDTCDIGHAVGSCGFCLEQNPDTVLAIDGGFISHTRWERIPLVNHYPVTMPDLAVEVVSIFDEQPYIDAKTQMWLGAGVRLALVVYPETQEVYAHHSDGLVVRYGIGDTVVGDPVLPGFTCPVADIFAFGPRQR